MGCSLTLFITEKKTGYIDSVTRVSNGCAQVGVSLTSPQERINPGHPQKCTGDLDLGLIPVVTTLGFIAKRRQSPIKVLWNRSSGKAGSHIFLFGTENGEGQLKVTLYFNTRDRRHIRKSVHDVHGLHVTNDHGNLVKALNVGSPHL